MKNLCSEDYLLISRMFSKKKINENVTMQNAIISKRMIKMKKKSMSKNLSVSKTESDVQNKKIQNIIKEHVNTEKMLNLLMNLKMQDVIMRQMLELSFALFRSFFD
jgi:hypothetical protein